MGVPGPLPPGGDGTSAADLLQQFSGGAAAGQQQLPQQVPPPPTDGDVNLQVPAEKAIVGTIINVDNGMRFVIVEIIGQPAEDGTVGVRATPAPQGQGAAPAPAPQAGGQGGQI